MAEWSTPKTNWTSDDYFNASDYNRMVNNLLYLKDYAHKLFQKATYDAMSADKTYLYMIYAKEFNAIEKNLEALNLSSYSFSIGEQKTYAANRKVPDYAEYNRIESAMLKIKSNLDVSISQLPKLAFTLGNNKGVKV